MHEAALRWKQYVSQGRASGHELPSNHYAEVAYEELLADPRGTLTRLCGFLNEAFVEAVLSPTVYPAEDRTRLIGRTPEPRFDTRQLNPQNVDRWQSMMKRSNRVIVESVAGDVMRDLGYRLEGRTRPIRSPERLLWRLHHYVRLVLARLNRKSTYRWLGTYLSLHRAGLRRSSRR